MRLKVKFQEQKILECAKRSLEFDEALILALTENAQKQPQF